ncbi:UDP-galactose/UDP-glucose transporter 5B [Linum grandiflorum]
MTWQIGFPPVSQSPKRNSNTKTKLKTATQTNKSKAKKKTNPRDFSLSAPPPQLHFPGHSPFSVPHSPAVFFSSRRIFPIQGMADSASLSAVKENKLWKGVFAVGGIMITLVIYGVLQEKIMRVPYGVNNEYFKYSLFLVFCNRVTTSAISAISLVASKKALDPVAPVYKYCLISISNILTTTCQYEALKYVSFPVQTLAKCAKMIPVMIWGTCIMQKKYKGKDYLLAFLVTIGCSVFILFPAGSELNPYSRGRENTVWGVSLMAGYLGFDGFTSTFQDKLFKGYDMEIHNQIFYTTLCSCFLSFTGMILQGHLLLAIDFIHRHHDCFLDVALLSAVATASQFFISYTIRTFGALTFAAIMTTRQLVSILLSCVWFSHPLSWEQWIGAVIVFGSLYAKNLWRNAPPKSPPQPSEVLQEEEEAALNPPKQ